MRLKNCVSCQSTTSLPMQERAQYTRTVGCPIGWPFSDRRGRQITEHFDEFTQFFWNIMCKSCMQFYDKSILVALKDNVREPVHYMVARPGGKILSSNNNLLFLAFIEDFILQICCKLGIVLLVRVGPTCPKHCHATSTNNRTSHQLLITQIKHSLKYVNCSFLYGT